jgi:hypothetical protein
MLIDACLRAGCVLTSSNVDWCMFLSCNIDWCLFRSHMTDSEFKCSFPSRMFYADHFYSPFTMCWGCILVLSFFFLLYVFQDISVTSTHTCTSIFLCRHLEHWQVRITCTSIFLCRHLEHWQVWVDFALWACWALLHRNVRAFIYMNIVRVVQCLLWMLF